MAVTPQHQKSEPDEKDLEHAYNRARSIGLFLVEKYAREGLRDNPDLKEFVMAMGAAFFTGGEDDDEHADVQDVSSDLWELILDWDDALKLTGEPMRFTADGPVRREW
jgi:hypothetical protein